MTEDSTMTSPTEADGMREKIADAVLAAMRQYRSASPDRRGEYAPMIVAEATDAILRLVFPGAAAPSPAGGGDEAIADVVSHASDWRTALTAMRDGAPEPETGVQDDRSYWQHQLDVLDRILAALSTSPAGGGVEALRSAMQMACDLLAERTYGSNARSPGHNARLVLEQALSRPVSPVVEGLGSLPAASQPSVPTEEAETPVVVWAVGGTVGDYSDRSEWVVGAWEREADAKAFVLRIEALTRQAESLVKTRGVDAETRAAWDAAVAECVAVDPSWSNDFWDGPRYTAWPMTIHPAARQNDSTEGQSGGAG